MSTNREIDAHNALDSGRQARPSISAASMTNFGVLISPLLAVKRALDAFNEIDCETAPYAEKKT